ncbi:MULTISPECIES: hypothetical protein [Delftia]|uniref:hypothetical protein n=1 Tax=Delftia TaxID=80865 RepID=UPI0008EA099A|nr:hypothetical protein SAMN05444579_10560 [Delftia tsuruhatensis]
MPTSGRNLETFAFDPAGNLLNPNRGGDLSSGGTSNEREQVPTNRLAVYQDLRFQYDLHGNIVERRIGWHTVQRFRYSAEHQIEEHVELCDGLERPDFSSGDAVPQRDLSGDVCLTQFGDGQLNRAASNPWGVAALAVATFTRLQASPHEWRIRGGAAAFYPFQHPMQQAMLLTELQLPLANMPGQMAGLRLCLDVPAI